MISSNLLEYFQNIEIFEIYKPSYSDLTPSVIFLFSCCFLKLVEKGCSKWVKSKFQWNKKVAFFCRVQSAYLMWHSVKVMIPEVLGRYKEIIDEYQMEVSGTKVPSPRWEVCVTGTLRVFAGALARPFVKDVYDSTAKTMVGTSSGKKIFFIIHQFFIQQFLLFILNEWCRIHQISNGKENFWGSLYETSLLSIFSQRRWFTLSKMCSKVILIPWSGWTKLPKPMLNERLIWWKIL